MKERIRQEIGARFRLSFLLLSLAAFLLTVLALSLCCFHAVLFSVPGSSRKSVCKDGALF